MSGDWDAGSLVRRLVGVLPTRVLRMAMAAAWRFPRARRTLQPLMRAARGTPRPIGHGPGKGLKFSAGTAPLVYATGKIEEPVQSAFVAEIAPGETVFDIGANVGFYTLLAARSVGTAGHVVAFEPNPANAFALAANVAANSFENVTIVEKAVSSHDGPGILDVSVPFSSRMAVGESEATIPVGIVSIDGFLAGHPHLVPRLVKVDVEGDELAVLEGMSHLLETARPVVIVELHHKIDRGVRGRVEEIMASHGYAVEALEDATTLRRSPGWAVQHLLCQPSHLAR